MFNIINSFCIGPGEISTSANNLCYSSSLQPLRHYDLLIFIDSRGLERDCSIEEAWLYKFCLYLDKQNYSYLTISRPKNVTIFATLINFLKNTEISFSHLITNVGFVDCTPKKESVLDDMKQQIVAAFDCVDTIPIKELGEFTLSNNNTSKLYSLIYDAEYTNYISAFLTNKFKKVLLINTPIINESIKIPRSRPKAFFSQLVKTNELIIQIAKEPIKILDVSNLFSYDNSPYTYDAVHYTKKGHDLIYSSITKNIILGKINGN